MNRLLPTICLYLIFQTSQAQQPETLLAKYVQDYQPDKVYLHYDKSTYFPGETIWFKAYLMEGMFPALKSKNLYVDFVSDSGNVLAHNVGPVVEGTSNGQFDVPESYNGDYIHVRAYTKWMLNDDTAFLYNKNIKIHKFGKKAVDQFKKRRIHTTQLNFFPEGGELIAGLPNRVAFKSNDQWGNPISIRGAIKDNRGKLVDSFYTIHDGMGSFAFTPQSGKTYKVRWRDEFGKIHNDTLPDVKQHGFTMQVTMTGSKRIITVNGNEKQQNDLKGLHLVGTMNHTIAFNEEVNIERGKNIKRVIPTEKFPTGILTITLFNAEWKPVAERICFIDNGNYSLQPELEVRIPGTGKRERNEIEISLPDSLEGASLSVSVTDNNIIKDTTDHIISHLLLQSDVRGKIHNPAYYFSSSTPDIPEHLDLVMLTHGWRKFRWDEILHNKPGDIAYPRDTSYLSLSGKLYGVASSELSGENSILLMVKEKDDTSFKMLVLPIEKDGSFRDPEVVIFDTVQVFYEAKSKLLTKAHAKFMTERLPAPDYSDFRKYLEWVRVQPDTSGYHHQLMVATEALEIKEERKRHIMEMIRVATIEKTMEERLEDKYPSGVFRGGNSLAFDLINNPAASGTKNVLSYLQGRVAGLQIVNRGQTMSLTWRTGTPAIYLDEFEVTPEMVNMIAISEIAYIKVFRPPFRGSFYNAFGAIAIYMRKGNDVITHDPESLSANNVTGYSAIREFYSPDYATADETGEKDVRTTLYWNPQVVTSKGKNKVLIHFYNNDVSDSLRIVVEGMTTNGLLIHKEMNMSDE